MERFRFINNVAGWIIFTVAAWLYLTTMESTTSLWDCGERILSAYKMQIGHPPGDPIFMLLQRFATLFAFGDVTKVAVAANAMSALASAFTVLFLFWVITHMARRILLTSEDSFTTPAIVAVISAGTVGALTLTFSDTFWFSAVEAEVYATSTFVTALVFWLILRWEETAEKPHSGRWLILIAYITGLSIGIHLLNLLVIPAIVFIVYFKRYEFNLRGVVMAVGASVALLSLIMWGIIPGVPRVGAAFELFFINSLGLPFNTGVLIHLLLLVIFMILSIRLTMKRTVRFRLFATVMGALLLTGIWMLSDSLLLNIIILLTIAGVIWWLAGEGKTVFLNTAMTVLLVILMGYSSYALVVIRASADPPMNQNNPSNIFALMYYLSREQYGQRPLLHGQYYNAPVVDYETLYNKPVYRQIDGKYQVVRHDFKTIYDDRFTTVLPRMFSNNPNHVEVYRDFGRVRGVPVTITDRRTGERRTERRPRFVENIRFMISYQINHMYTRYLLWNFSGRQNDNQNVDGNAINGNWITGLDFIDRHFTGSAADMPDSMSDMPSRNRYYMLPLLLGLAGLIYQLTRDARNWWVVLLLFVMTGLAIIVYLNQTPIQPRERDYAYSGSFFAFSIWVGMGVLMIYDLFARVIPSRLAAPLAGVISLLAVPLVMASENYDDHDRSGRYLTRDVAANYLNSLAPNAILFTNGDNDTFPLWYAQEVEGIRTDVRVCNLMLLNTDWYISQMKRRTYESAPLPITMPPAKYFDGINNQVYIDERVSGPRNIKEIVDFVISDHPDSKLRISPTESYDFIYARTLRIPVDKEKVLASGTVRPEDADLIVPYIDIELEGGSVLKNQMILLDILANNNWERPIYFVTGYHGDALGLEEYFQLEGIAYRLVPIRSHNRSWLDYGRVDTETMYNNVMNKFQWRGAADEGVYIDFFHRRTLQVIRARHIHARLARELAAKGDKERAVRVLDHCVEVLPFNKIPHDLFSSDIVEAYFEAGAPEKAYEVARDAAGYFLPRLDYFFGGSSRLLSSAEFEVRSSLQTMQRVALALRRNGYEEFGGELNEIVEGYQGALALIGR